MSRIWVIIFAVFLLSGCASTNNSSTKPQVVDPEDDYDYMDD